MRLLYGLSGIAVLGSCLWADGAIAQQVPAPTLTAQATTQSDPLNYDEYMSLGYNAQQEGRYYEAAQYFRYALYFNPEDRAAVIAYWNARDALQDGADEALSFDEYMNQGYDATEAGNYPTALEYFRQAYALRPGDYYADQAIRNVRTYINSEDVIQQAGGPTLSATAMATPGVAAEPYLGETAYDRYMRLGYAAQQEESFTTAAEYFRSALYERPNDRWATIAYWNAIDGTNDGEAGLGSPAGDASRYDRLMRLGYDATQREDYTTAIDFFQRALETRPDDYYATEALENVRTYLSE